MKRFVVAMSVCGWLWISPPVAAQAPALPAECLQADAAPPGPPVFPPGLAAQGDSGKVVLVLTYDHCGRTTDLVVEQSSGQPELDAAALDAARTWRFRPQLRDGRHVGGKVRVPVDFSADIDAPSLVADRQEMSRLRGQWARMQVPEVRADRDATVPSFLADPEPLPVASVEEAERLATARGKQVEAPANVRAYRIQDGLEITAWEFYGEGWAFAPSAIRRRLVSDGKKAFWVTAGLCGATAKTSCELLDQFMRQPGRQATIPPPPPPPPPSQG